MKHVLIDGVSGLVGEDAGGEAAGEGEGENKLCCLMEDREVDSLREKEKEKD